MCIDPERAMSADSPPGDDGIEAARRLSGLDDEGLLAELREMFDQQQAVPGWLVDRATASHDLRLTDSELATLTSDSAMEPAGAGLRAEDGPRLVTFEAQDLSIEIEIQPSGCGEQWRLIGQLIPIGRARIQLRRPQSAESAWVYTDERGRFAVDDLARGLLSMVCVRQDHPTTTTAWITIG